MPSGGARRSRRFNSTKPSAPGFFSALTRWTLKRAEAPYGTSLNNFGNRLALTRQRPNFGSAEPTFRQACSLTYIICIRLPRRFVRAVARPWPSPRAVPTGARPTAPARLLPQTHPIMGLSPVSIILLAHPFHQTSPELRPSFSESSPGSGHLIQFRARVERNSICRLRSPGFTAL